MESRAQNTHCYLLLLCCCKRQTCRISGCLLQERWIGITGTHLAGISRAQLNFGALFKSISCHKVHVWASYLWSRICLLILHLNLVTLCTQYFNRAGKKHSLYTRFQTSQVCQDWHLYHSIWFRCYQVHVLSVYTNVSLKERSGCEGRGMGDLPNDTSFSLKGTCLRFHKLLNLTHCLPIKLWGACDVSCSFPH